MWVALALIGGGWVVLSILVVASHYVMRRRLAARKPIETNGPDTFTTKEN